jgi:parallel beta-helix repeat protein
MNKETFMAAIIISALLFSLVVEVHVVKSAKTITVPDDYPSIQAAVGNASSGDTVFVRSGNYAGGIALNKPISLRGEDAKSTVIVGGATLKDLGVNSTVVQGVFSGVSASADKSFELLNSPAQTLDMQTASLRIQPANFIPPPTFAVYINSSDVSISGFTILGVDYAINGNGDRLQIYKNTLGTCSLQGSSITVATNTRIGLQIGGSQNLIVGNSGCLSLTCSNSTILENSLTYFESGNANSNIIVNNTLSGANMGMWIGSYAHSCSYNLFAGNKIEKSGLWGILMGAGSYNVFFGNIVENTGVGIGHDGYGLALGGNGVTAENNLFLRNIFVNNSKNFGVNWPVTGTNSFDDGKEGNYWDDYLTKYPNASEADQSGTGNTPYVLTGNNMDNHPLLRQPDISDKVPVLPEPWKSVLPVLLPLTSYWHLTSSSQSSSSSSTATSPSSSISPTVLILSPANQSYAAIYNPVANVPLTYWTNASISWVGYSLDGGTNITAPVNGTLIEIPDESRFLTLYANDTEGNWATPQTVYYDIAFNLGAVPEEPFPWLLVAAVSVVVAAVIAVAAMIYLKKREQGVRT